MTEILRMRATPSQIATLDRLRGERTRTQVLRAALNDWVSKETRLKSQSPAGGTESS